jgi:hypothetical protein
VTETMHLRCLELGSLGNMASSNRVDTERPVFHPCISPPHSVTAHVLYTHVINKLEVRYLYLIPCSSLRESYRLRTYCFFSFLTLQDRPGQAMTCAVNRQTA